MLNDVLSVRTYRTFMSERTEHNAPSPRSLGWGTDSVPARVGPSGCSSLIKDESGSWSSDVRVRLNCRITELRQPIFWGNEILLSL